MEVECRDGRVGRVRRLWESCNISDVASTFGHPLDISAMYNAFSPSRVQLPDSLGFLGGPTSHRIGSTRLSLVAIEARSVRSITGNPTRYYLCIPISSEQSSLMQTTSIIWIERTVKPKWTYCCIWAFWPK